MSGNRRIFYDTAIGEVIQEIGRNGSFSLPTIEQDVSTYKTLSERKRETFDVIELPFGQYAQDFAECNGYRVNPETREIEFSYPEPNQPEQPPVYQEPLSEQVKRLKDRQDATEEAMLGLLLGGM